MKVACLDSGLPYPEIRVHPINVRLVGEGVTPRAIVALETLNIQQQVACFLRVKGILPCWPVKVFKSEI